MWETVSWGDDAHLAGVAEGLPRGFGGTRRRRVKETSARRSHPCARGARWRPIARCSVGTEHAVHESRRDGDTHAARFAEFRAACLSARSHGVPSPTTAEFAAAAASARAPRCFPATFFPTAFVERSSQWPSSVSPPRLSSLAHAPKHESVACITGPIAAWSPDERGVRVVRVRQHRAGGRGGAGCVELGLQLAHERLTRTIPRGRRRRRRPRVRVARPRARRPRKMPASTASMSSGLRAPNDPPARGRVARVAACEAEARWTIFPVQRHGNGRRGRRGKGTNGRSGRFVRSEGLREVGGGRVGPFVDFAAHDGAGEPRGEFRAARRSVSAIDTRGSPAATACGSARRRRAPGVHEPRGRSRNAPRAWPRSAWDAASGTTSSAALGGRRGT